MTRPFSRQPIYEIVQLEGKRLETASTASEALEQLSSCRYWATRPTVLRDGAVVTAMELNTLAEAEARGVF